MSAHGTEFEMVALDVDYLSSRTDDLPLKFRVQMPYPCICRINDMSSMTYPRDV